MCTGKRYPCVDVAVAQPTALVCLSCSSHHDTYRQHSKYYAWLSRDRYVENTHAPDMKALTHVLQPPHSSHQPISYPTHLFLLVLVEASFNTSSCYRRVSGGK
ncbi:hypothetical protein C0Q70_20332 [Pomacea canaliculata]|uniref:Uncharacterized protein n=1 Tax=Pomacea canaliculata TaxID=400727 RepID=A0A2T7NF80_POMCA|nr:hypothetical protein C0Q70_20332 [Pomacea canaliculata]